MSSVVHVFDSEYVNGLRRGDPAIEAHFVDHFSPILLRMLRRKVRSADHARDLRQETFFRVLKAVRCGPGLQNPERFHIFVIGVCNNIVRETYREQSRSVPLSELKDDPVADFPCAHALVVAREARNKVRRTLAQMSPTEQDILRGMFLDEQSKDEICRRLGISRDYLRVLLHRAKKQFGMRAEKDKFQATPPHSPQSASHGCGATCGEAGNPSGVPSTVSGVAFRLRSPRIPNRSWKSHRAC